MHICLDNIHQGGKYTAQISIQKEELRRDEEFTDRKSLSITYLQTDYLNLYRSPGSGKNIGRSNLVHKKCTFVEVLTIIQKNVLRG